VEAHLRQVKIAFLVVTSLAAAALVAAQAPAPQQPAADQTAPQAAPATPNAAPAGRGRGGRGGGGRTAYPVRAPADPALVQRGQQIFSVNCSFCHGTDARGGEGGPNLIRSELVMDDNNGEIIATVVQNGRPGTAMPKFDLSMQDIAAIAAFIHSFPVGGRAAITGTVDPLVGDAKAGEAYFNGPGKCSTCHSATGDLAGIGDKLGDPRAVQGAILSGQIGGGRGAAAAEGEAVPVKTVTVTLPSGKVVEGTLDRIDDFLVSLTDADGNHLTFVRNGDVPNVVVKNPLQPHLDMLPNWKDDDMHNLTAYLVTLK
jgi:cytochrome c oxidase cbb3-type subunit III